MTRNDQQLITEAYMCSVILNEGFKEKLLGLLAAVAIAAPILMGGSTTANYKSMNGQDFNSLPAQTQTQIKHIASATDVQSMIQSIKQFLSQPSNKTTQTANLLKQLEKVNDANTLKSFVESNWTHLQNNGTDLQRGYDINHIMNGMQQQVNAAKTNAGF